jgi:methionyl aminopeptidase
MQYSPTPAPASSKDATGHVLIKSPADQAGMRVAGRLAAEVLDMIGPKVVAGITTDELNQICHDYIVDRQQAIPAGLPRLS